MSCTRISNTWNNPVLMFNIRRLPIWCPKFKNSNFSTLLQRVDRDDPLKLVWIYFSWNSFSKSLVFVSGVGGRDAGGASAPPKVLICQKPGQIPWKSGQNQWKFGQIYENVGKIPGNLGKPWKFEQKWHPTLFDFKKWPPRFAETHEDAFLVFTSTKKSFLI